LITALSEKFHIDTSRLKGPEVVTLAIAQLRSRSTRLLIVLLVALVAFVISVVAFTGSRGSPGTTENHARLELLLKDAHDPHFTIVDDADEVARQARTSFVLFNLNHLTRLPNGDVESLQMRSAVDDYVSPHAGLHSDRLLEMSEQIKQAKSGELIFGYITIECENCGIPRSWWVCLMVGNAGWVSEVPRDVMGQRDAKLAAILYSDSPDRSISQLVPISSRVAV
jgi:hypothetical protein